MTGLRDTARTLPTEMDEEEEVPGVQCRPRSAFALPHDAAPSIHQLLTLHLPHLEQAHAWRIRAARPGAV